MATETEWHVINTSLAVAALSLALSIIPGILTGWLLARKSFPGKVLLEIIIFLPLVLPPVVTGYLILVCWGRRGWIGRPLHEWTGIDIVFTWKAMVLAGAGVGFPLLVRSIRAAIEAVDVKLEQAVRTLGVSSL